MPVLSSAEGAEIGDCGFLSGSHTAFAGGAHFLSTRDQVTRPRSIRSIRSIRMVSV
jgi:hypothetical protein